MIMKWNIDRENWIDQDHWPRMQAIFLSYTATRKNGDLQLTCDCRQGPESIDQQQNKLNAHVASDREPKGKPINFEWPLEDHNRNQHQGTGETIEISNYFQAKHKSWHQLPGNDKAAQDYEEAEAVRVKYLKNKGYWEVAKNWEVWDQRSITSPFDCQIYLKF